MATVYLATDVKHDRPVALKVLRPELTLALGGDRFPREIQIVAQLSHPHILPLHDSGERGGFLYYVMPYVDGQSLRARLRSEGKLSVEESIRILREIADALAYAHGRGIIHRDIKPENVMISGRHALVMDFGVAKAVSAASSEPLTTVGIALGTPTYMSPEQAMGQPDIDARSDIYALGILGYEMLAGAPPFVRDTPQALLSAQVIEPPKPVTEIREHIPGALGDLVMRCLAKDPADRWPDAEEVHRRLEQ
jgi:serine/threonine-protein kinase